MRVIGMGYESLIADQEVMRLIAHCVHKIRYVPQIQDGYIDLHIPHLVELYRRPTAQVAQQFSRHHGLRQQLGSCQVGRGKRLRHLGAWDEDNYKRYFSVANMPEE